MNKNEKNRAMERHKQIEKWQLLFGRQSQEKVQKKNNNASVPIKETWTVIEEMDFPELSKLSLPTVSEPVDLLKCGSLEFYDNTYNGVTTNNEKKLARVNRFFHNFTTTDDPNIRMLAKNGGNVFATDAILSTIMCSSRSFYSWDIVVCKIGEILFFDKRDKSEIDLPTVSETATEPPQEEPTSLNSSKNLALEAMAINHNFSQQALKMGKERHKFGEPNPFSMPDDDDDDDDADVASVGYRYRKWDLGNGIVLVCRCEHDCVTNGPNGEIQYMNVKALNEWDSKLSGGVDWRSKLDSQRGAVLATELKNNSCKLAKWTVSSLLAGSDLIKFGYVSRVNSEDSSKHVILGTQEFKPAEFAQQINLNMDNCWGVLRCIIDICMKQKEGKYLLMKDPNKPMIRLYNIPNNSFESEDDSNDSDDDYYGFVR